MFDILIKLPIYLFIHLFIYTLRDKTHGESTKGHKVPYKDEPPMVSERNRKQSRYRHTKYNDLQKRTACIQGKDKNKNRSEFDNIIN